MQNGTLRRIVFVFLAFGTSIILLMSGLLLSSGPVATLVLADSQSISLRAPFVTKTIPFANAVDVPVDQDVTVYFDEAIDLTSVNTRTFAVYGSQSPIFDGSYNLRDISQTVVLDPYRDYFPGELMYTTITTGTQNITGENAIAPMFWQFRAAVGGGSGIFYSDGYIGSYDIYDAAFGDMDGDGDLDLVAVYGSSAIPNKVWFNDATGYYPVSRTFATTAGYGVALGDLDLDGDLDAFVANEGYPNSVFWNESGLLLDSDQTIGEAMSHKVALGDLDRDGDLDAFVANSSFSANTVWFNAGDGFFMDSGQSLGAESSEDVVLGDLDGDADLDALVANEYAEGAPIRMWFNDGSGYFPISRTLTFASSYSVDLGDVERDGDLDIFITDNRTGWYSHTLWLNAGSGDFSVSSQDFGNFSSSSVDFGDLDGDGDLDIAIGYNDNYNQVWLNRGDGQFTQLRAGVLGYNWGLIALGDIDGDNDLDAVGSGPFVIPGTWRNRTRVVEVDPRYNQVSAPFFYPLVATTNGEIDPNSLDSRSSIVVHGGFQGTLLGTVGLSHTTNTVVFTPAQNLLPGEFVNASLTPQVLDKLGGAVVPHVWQYHYTLPHERSPGFFVASNQLLTGSLSTDVALGDLDLDGDLDAFIGNRSSPDTVLFNDGAGNFIDSGQSLSISSTLAIALGDWDGDGDLDAYSAKGGVAEDQAWFNNGDGTFVASPQLLDNSGGHSLDIGDVNGDGYLDVLIINSGGGLLYLNDGTGLFSISSQSLDSFLGNAGALGDLDLDGDLDAFIVNDAYYPDKVWLNDGSGVFTDTLQELGMGNSSSVVLYDFDGDMDLDAFVGQSGADAILWLNDGTGIFTQSSPSWPPILDTQVLAVGLLNGDVAPDVFVGMNGVPGQVLLNTGSGQFVSNGQQLDIGYVSGIALGDLDDDDDLDAFVVTDGTFNYVWLNESTCYARPSDGSTDGPIYGSLQAAVDASAAPYNLVKVAGVCSGVTQHAGISQTVYISKSLVVQGGYTITDWTTSNPLSYPTTLDAVGEGRVAYIIGDVDVTLKDLILTNGYDAGGGLYILSATVSLDQVSLVTNTSSNYGGGLYAQNSQLNMTSSNVAYNQSTAPGDSASGAGLYIVDSVITFTANTIMNNSVSGYSASDGGGAYLNSVSGVFIDNEVKYNEAGVGAGVYLNGSSPQFERNLIQSNHAINGNGGGLYMTMYSEPVLINNVLADNQADSVGDGVYMNSSSVTLLHTTLARNGETGMYVGSGSQAWLTNTIVYSHITGIEAISGTTVLVDGVLWQDNQANILGDGISSVTNAYTGTPAFDSDGYHLTEFSPAVNKAVAIGVTDDIDAESRPYGQASDLGADEYVSLLQLGPVFTVTLTEDRNESCLTDDCSLREAILAAKHNRGDYDEIVFNIAMTGPHTITLSAPLPVITESLTIDGCSEPDADCSLGSFSLSVILDGSQAGDGAHGLRFATAEGASAGVGGLVITGFSGDGVRVLSGTGIRIMSNRIYGNGGLGIDLNGDGVTLNDVDDNDGGPNSLQNYPVLLSAVPGTLSTTVLGRINSITAANLDIELFASLTCDPSGHGEGYLYLGKYPVQTDVGGDVYFYIVIDELPPVPEGYFLSATATGWDSGTSEFSLCAVVGPDNTSWPKAKFLELSEDEPNVLSTAIEQRIELPGQSRWYKFPVQPGSRLIVTLLNLPDNYDLTIYKDIAQAFKDLTSPQDLVELNAEFAPDAFAPDAFAPDAFAPDAFAPDAFAPDAFAPDAFAPDAFAPDAFAPDAFAPDAFAPDAFAPDAFAPDAFAPDAFAPDAFAPDAFAPDAFAPDAFASAQTRSLIGISAFDGTTSEGVALNTWSNDTEFYIRVRGRYGAYSLEQPFRLEVKMQTSGCDAVSDDLPATSLVPTYKGYNTVILVDFDRMEGTAVDKETLLARLAALADRPEVNGVIVDVGQDARVVAANEQADAYPACPYAKNLVADAIKAIVDSYRVENPLEYVVIVGNDDVIPFFRHPDQALLASEKNYAPPVRDNTASQASLKLGYVLSQDRYGAQTEISYMADRLPVPDLAVGRLVETPADVITLLEAYLSTEGGVVPTPSSALVTGYDFLEDAAEAVLVELEAGLGTTADTLIAPREMSPADPDAWTADDLRALITQNRYDLAYLAGHFSASSALAADYATRLFSTDIVSSTVDMTNAILFSAGCHSGYNIVNEHGVTNVTREPDWAQAFARKGVTLIAGTGYQYGDTDLIKYSERLYLEFSRELRYGSGPVAVGQALVNAKQTYLNETPELRGIHVKALLEATLFGLPMLQVELPRGRDRQPAMLSDSPIVLEIQPFTSDPGLTLGLEFADITATLQLTQGTKALHILGTTDEVIMATYLSGKDGMTLNPVEPALPVAFYNVTAPRSDTVLRGVGFRGGLYHELPDVLPLTGAPATEVRGIHPPFYTDVFYPLQPWRINYFDALRRGSEGMTRLALSPAQYMSGSAGEITGILRVFDEMQFRLYYSGNFKTYGAGSTPAQSAPPYISNVAANYIKNSLVFRVRVNGNPAAGIQEVWVTYSKPDGFWRSLDLVQDRELSTLWWGVLPVGSSVITDMRYMVQAVNGVGLVAIDTNQGAYYTPGDNPGSEPSPTAYDTELVFQSPPTTGTYGSLLTFKVRLTRSSDGVPLADKLLTFGLGSLRRRAKTDSYGMTSVTLPLQVLPGEQEVRVSFAGSGDALLAKAVTPLTVLKQATSISLASGNDEEMLVATLADVDGRPLKEMPVLFVVGDEVYQVLAPTDYAGRAALGPVSLPDGAYPVRVTFGSAVLLGDGEVIDLRDDRYMPSFQSRILNLGSHSMYLPVIMRE